VSPPVRVHKVRELFRATGNTIIGLEFSVSGDSMLKTLRQWFNFRRITKAANLFLESLGPAFTKTTGGHIQTDIAGASAVAGLCVLRNAEPNLESVPPGTPFLCELHAAQSDVLDFMTRMSFNMGMGGLNGWEAPISSANKPMMEVPQMTRRLEPSLVRACHESGLSRNYWAFAAALAAIKLIAAGKATGILDEAVGKSIAVQHFVTGSKTAPHPLGEKPT
jgi:hypothetical protein